MPPRSPKHEAAALKAQGLRPAGIAKVLGRSERTIYRLLKEADEEQLVENYLPWTLLDSIEAGDKGEKIRYLLLSRDIWASKSAEYAWAIAEVRPELPVALVQTLAALYVSAHYEEDSWERKRRAWILDSALRCQPWTGPEARDRFFAAALTFVEANDRSMLAWISDVEEQLLRSFAPGKPSNGTHSASGGIDLTSSLEASTPSHADPAAMNWLRNRTKKQRESGRRALEGFAQALSEAAAVLKRGGRGGEAQTSSGAPVSAREPWAP